MISYIVSVREVYFCLFLCFSGRILIIFQFLIFLNIFLYWWLILYLYCRIAKLIIVDTCCTTCQGLHITLKHVVWELGFELYITYTNLSRRPPQPILQLCRLTSIVRFSVNVCVRCSFRIIYLFIYLFYSFAKRILNRVNNISQLRVFQGSLFPSIFVELKC